MTKKKNHSFWNWGYSSEVEYLPNTHEALGSIPSTVKRNNLSYPRGNYFIIANKNICIFLQLDNNKSYIKKLSLIKRVQNTHQ